MNYRHLGKTGLKVSELCLGAMEQLESNLGAAGWSLLPEDVAKLDSASEILLPYPYDFIAKAGR
jgi:aryl-alcohol dehydrogenase-like predicted oxidoreductase